jgi:hypothetical protein
MYISSFYTSSSPYYFLTPSSSLNKASMTNIVEGRGVIIKKDGVLFTYRFEGLNVDGKSISFVGTPDSLDYSDVNVLNNYLLSEPFQINSNSNITFIENSGFSDSTEAKKMLGESKIHYKLELIDENDKVVGKIKEVNFTSSNTQSAKSHSFSLDTKEFDSKTVQARITFETNIVDKEQKPSNTSQEIPSYISNEIVENRLKTKIPNILLVKSYIEKDIYLAKSTSSVEEILVKNIELPSEFSLEQNYPNPFNPVTSIQYKLPTDCKVVLSVYDLNGRLVEAMVNEMQSAGSYRVLWNAGAYSSGVYFYKIQAGDFSQVRKCILLK